VRRAGDEPKRRWIDGTPLNTFYVSALLKLFPHAQFIHNLRRPDEVATSLEAFDKVGAVPQALEQGLETWIAHTDNAWHAERALGRDRAFRLDFNRIADEPEALFRELCGFLGEEFAPECLLPLERKVNSSEVEDKREENLALLRGNPVFRRAQAVYDTVARHPVGERPEAGALGVLERRLEDYCRNRSIV